ncbi:MAG: winged helix-turn-helix transcriptional regulator [Planctomycetia bacterium]|nr:winged helix-turn-helix transcriptional regulator [Planctomycetia bacterium]
MQDPLQPQHCARLLRALADPDRLRIIRLLSDGPSSVKDMAARLEAQVVNVSHHLGVLRQAGLVRDERQGRFVLYHLSPNVFQPAAPDARTDHLDLGCCRLEIPKRA